MFASSEPELDYTDDDVFDDPFEVVMYDIETGPDDVYALIDMLSDKSRSWYARRRLNALVASGPLSALVADIIIDSLGRRWNPLEHPRDRFGRFIETGGFIRWLSKGKWLRGQISRIDSDGVIHARSAGNDGMADGAGLRFKPEMASKLVSIESPVADLNLDAPEGDVPEADVPGDIDLDAEIPDFPEATPTQRRIYNALAAGDMPAEDLDRYRAPDDPDMAPSDFANELVGLEERGLVEMDSSPDPDGVKITVRRTDGGGAEQKAEIDVADIDDVPDDETPDLEDSPAFTREQRDLLDKIAELDAGDGSGVEIEQLNDEGIDPADLEALINAGAVQRSEADDRLLFLENPEADGADVPAADVPEPDISTEIFDAAQERIDDPDAQEAFQHYAEELARPGDEANIPLPEGVSPAKRRNAQALAEAWWEERNAGTLDRADEAVLDQREEDKFADEGPDPKDVLNPRNQAMADGLAAEWFPDEDYLDSNEGVEYRTALKRLFDAEDLAENGFGAQADAERDKANRAMKRIEVPDTDIAGWPLEVQNWRNADREAEGEPVDVDVIPDGTPGADVIPEEVPETPLERAAPVDLLDRPGAKLYLRDHPRAQELMDEGASEYEWGYEAATLDEAEGLPPLTDEEHAELWGDSPYAEGYQDQVEDRAGVPGQDATPAPEDAAPEPAVEEPDSLEINTEDEQRALDEAENIEADEAFNPAAEEPLDNDADGIGNLPPDDLPEASIPEMQDDNGPIDEDALAERMAQAAQDAMREFVKNQNEDLNADDELNQALDERQAEEDAADVPNADQAELQRQENYGQNDGEVKGQRQFQPQDIPLLANEENWAGWEERQAAHEVAQAMWDAQNNILAPQEAYDVAAERVGNGLLNQRLLEQIQDGVKEHLEGRGQKWVQAYEIDYVGDDQGAVPVPEGLGNDVVPAADVPEHAKAVNQPGREFIDSNVVQEGFALDRNGQQVQVGNWYRADAGGEGDPGEMVGFFDQEKYPGWIALVMPDGKVKGVQAAGANRKDPVDANEWRAQRAVRNRAQETAGKGMPELDQFHRMLQIKNADDPNGAPVQAKLGMRVRSNSGGRKFPRGEEGVIVRFGWDAVNNRPKIYVLRPGAQNQRDEIDLAPKAVQFLPDTPALPTPEAPNVPDLDPANLPDREWPVPSDQELLDRINGLGGEVEFIPFNNAHQAPGVVYEQIMELVNQGKIEIVPAAENNGGRLKIRIPGGGQGAPDVNLPDGAENPVEGRVLDLIDAAGGEGLLRSALVDLDTDNVDEQFAAISGLVERGVLERYDDDPDGRARYRRAPAAPEATPLPDGANDELEAELLNVIDANETGVLPDALVDIDADDAAERMQALRSLVDRRVLQRDTPEEGGRPVYRRRQAADGAPVPMTDDEAIAALQGGASPLEIANPDLEGALRAGGYKFARNQSKGRSGNQWAIAPDSNPGPFSIQVRGSGAQPNHVYMVKQADPLIANSILNEVMASVLNEGVTEAVGRENPGVMFLPRVGIANAPSGVGKSAGGALIMDHAAYGYPEGHEFYSGDGLSKAQKRANGAASSMIRLALFDYMINNGIDRHSGNQMFAKSPDGSIEALIIDNGFGFGAPIGAGFSEGMPFTIFSEDSHYTKSLFRDAGLKDRNEVRQIVQDFVSAYQNIDVEATIARLRAAFPTMSASQEEYARKWFTEAKTRADALAGDIEGTVDIIIGA